MLSSFRESRTPWVRKIVASIFVTLLLFGAGTDGSPQQARQSPPPPTSPGSCGAAWDESLFTNLVKPDEPGLAVFVRCAGQASILRGYGVRDILRSKTPINSATNFRLASFTKQFTAMAIMLLVHDGKLQYDRTLASFWPDFPGY